MIEDDQDNFWISSCDYCHFGKEYGSNIYCTKRKEIKNVFDWCCHWQRKEKQQDELIFASMP